MIGTVGNLVYSTVGNSVCVIDRNCGQFSVLMCASEWHCGEFSVLHCE